MSYYLTKLRNYTVIKMIFKNKPDPMCCFCQFMTEDSSGKLFCSQKNKEVAEEDKCRKYKYDIFKKKILPKKKLDFSKYSKEDFRL